MADNNLPDFTGKLVVLYVTSPPAGMDAGVILEYPEFRRFGERLFVVGRVPEKIDSAWASRPQSAVAWNSIVHYLIFDSREDCERRVASAKPGLVKRLFK